MGEIVLENEPIEINVSREPVEVSVTSQVTDVTISPSPVDVTVDLDTTNVEITPEVVDVTVSVEPVSVDIHTGSIFNITGTTFDISAVDENGDSLTITSSNTSANPLATQGYVDENSGFDINAVDMFGDEFNITSSNTSANPLATQGYVDNIAAYQTLEGLADAALHEEATYEIPTNAIFDPMFTGSYWSTTFGNRLILLYDIHTTVATVANGTLVGFDTSSTPDNDQPAVIGRVTNTHLNANDQGGAIYLEIVKGASVLSDIAVGSIPASNAIYDNIFAEVDPDVEDGDVLTWVADSSATHGGTWQALAPADSGFDISAVDENGDDLTITSTNTASNPLATQDYVDRNTDIIRIPNPNVDTTTSYTIREGDVVLQGHSLFRRTGTTDYDIASGVDTPRLAEIDGFNPITTLYGTGTGNVGGDNELAYIGLGVSDVFGGDNTLIFSNSLLDESDALIVQLPEFQGTDGAAEKLEYISYLPGTNQLRLADHATAPQNSRNIFLGVRSGTELPTAASENPTGTQFRLTQHIDDTQPEGLYVSESLFGFTSNSFTNVNAVLDMPADGLTTTTTPPGGVVLLASDEGTWLLAQGSTALGDGADWSSATFLWTSADNGTAISQIATGETILLADDDAVSSEGAMGNWCVYNNTIAGVASTSFARATLGAPAASQGTIIDGTLNLFVVDGTNRSSNADILAEDITWHLSSSNYFINLDDSDHNDGSEMAARQFVIPEGCIVEQDGGLYVRSVEGSSFFETGDALPTLSSDSDYERIDSLTAPSAGGLEINDSNEIIISDDGVGFGKIEADAVRTSTIQDEAVTPAKLAPEVIQVNRLEQLEDVHLHDSTTYDLQSTDFLTNISDIRYFASNNRAIRWEWNATSDRPQNDDGNTIAVGDIIGFDAANNKTTTSAQPDVIVRITFLSTGSSRVIGHVIHSTSAYNTIPQSTTNTLWDNWYIIDTPDVQDGDVLTWDGTHWVPQPHPAAAGTNLSVTRSGTVFTLESSTGDNIALPVATTSLIGMMSDEDKTKLDGISINFDGTEVNNPDFVSPLASTISSIGVHHTVTGSDVTSAILTNEIPLDSNNLEFVTGTGLSVITDSITNLRDTDITEAIYTENTTDYTVDPDAIQVDTTSNGTRVTFDWNDSSERANVAVNELIGWSVTTDSEPSIVIRVTDINSRAFAGLLLEGSVPVDAQGTPDISSTEWDKFYKGTDDGRHVGDLLSWDGTNWINSPAPSYVNSLVDLHDVHIHIGREYEAFYFHTLPSAPNVSAGSISIRDGVSDQITVRTPFNPSSDPRWGERPYNSDLRVKIPFTGLDGNTYYIGTTYDNTQTVLDLSPPGHSVNIYQFTLDIDRAQADYDVDTFVNISPSITSIFPEITSDVGYVNWILSNAVIVSHQFGSTNIDTGDLIIAIEFDGDAASAITKNPGDTSYTLTPPQQSREHLSVYSRNEVEARLTQVQTDVETHLVDQVRQDFLDLVNNATERDRDVDQSFDIVWAGGRYAPGQQGSTAELGYQWNTVNTNSGVGYGFPLAPAENNFVHDNTTSTQLAYFYYLEGLSAVDASDDDGRGFHFCSNCVLEDNDEFNVVSGDEGRWVDNTDGSLDFNIDIQHFALDNNPNLPGEIDHALTMFGYLRHIRSLSTQPWQDDELHQEFWDLNVLLSQNVPFIRRVKRVNNKVYFAVDTNYYTPSLSKFSDIGDGTYFTYVGMQFETIELFHRDDDPPFEASDVFSPQEHDGYSGDTEWRDAAIHTFEDDDRYSFTAPHPITGIPYLGTSSFRLDFFLTGTERSDIFPSLGEPNNTFHGSLEDDLGNSYDVELDCSTVYDQSNPSNQHRVRARPLASVNYPDYFTFDKLRIQVRDVVDEEALKAILEDVGGVVYNSTDSTFHLYDPDQSDGFGTTISSDGGTAVTANPGGSPTTDLTTITIGGTNYNIAGGDGEGTIPVAYRRVTGNSNTYWAKLYETGSTYEYNVRRANSSGVFTDATVELTQTTRSTAITAFEALTATNFDTELS